MNDEQMDSCDWKMRSSVNGQEYVTSYRAPFLAVLVAAAAQRSVRCAIRQGRQTC